MKKLIRNVIVESISLWIIDILFSSIAFRSLGSLITTAFFLALLNSTVRPVLKALTLPVSLLTLGFFSLLVNGIVLMMAFSLSSGAYIGSFFSAVIASVCLAFVNGLVEDLLKDDE